MRSYARRLFICIAFGLTGAGVCASQTAGHLESLSILSTGAIGDGQTLNTKAIQSAIDRMADQGGGIVAIPAGVFVSGALYIKPGVNIKLERGAVLRCSNDLANFPVQRTRIEGHFETFNPALLNADSCDGLIISGEGTLDGAGRPIWDEFWRLRNATTDRANFRNLSVPRARLCLIQNSRNVTVSGVKFKDSQFWNLHLYNCRGVEVDGVSFAVPDDYKQAPSSDGIDVDSCQDVTIARCVFSVTDDCVALKGSKGPGALEDKSSPPVEHVRLRDCVFKRGHSAVTLGSEATIVRDVIVEKSRVEGPMAVLNFKLRTDTPQRYEDIHYRDIVVDADGGALIQVAPWKQYADLQGKAPPQSVVRNISLSNIHGRFGALGAIKGNPGQTSISDITVENIDVVLSKPELDAKGVDNFFRR